MRKQYLILIDGTWMGEPYLQPAYPSTIRDNVPGVDVEFISAKGAADIGLPDTDKFFCQDSEIGLLTRRRDARKALAELRKVFSDTYYTLRIVELGTFDRVVKPVKSWSIMRQWREVGSKNWSEPMAWVTGIALRADARKRAAEWQESMVGSDNPAYEFKFTVIPVYAKEQN